MAQLRSKGINSARLDAELIASYGLGKPRTWLHAHGEQVLSTAEQDKLDDWLDRRIHDEPFAYIIGRKEFFGRVFAVSPAVLIPRPETEAFIDIIKTLPAELMCLDIGTGSGILAITVALEQPSWYVTATDISPEALAVARRNAKALSATGIVFRKQNLLLKDVADYDVVLANLPYVPKNVCAKPELAHEPLIALQAGNDGLELYENLFAQLTQKSQKPRHVVVESLLPQHHALTGQARRAGYALHHTSGLVQHFQLRLDLV